MKHLILSLILSAILCSCETLRLNADTLWKINMTQDAIIDDVSSDLKSSNNFNPSQK